MTDPRTGTSETHYDTWGRVEWTEDAADNRTTYAYYRAIHANAGRIKSITNPESETQYFSYSPRGELERTWGSAVYPVMYAYDAFGRRTELRTYRGGSGWDQST